VYGVVGGIFSDVLGYHTVYGTIQAQGQLDEIGGNVVYLNQKHRVNWGASVARSPYIVGGYQAGYDTEGNLHNQLVIYRYFDNSAYGIAQYPFSRVRRVEFAAGARRITQDVKIQDWTYDPSGSALLNYTQSKQSLGQWNLGEATAAMVYDNAVDGYTSPIVGQRYRIEVAPTVGSLQFTSLTTDYRRYFLARPFTLAVRGLHYGRYGRDEAVPSAVFLGYPYLIRGYSYNSVTNACLGELNQQAGGGQECRVYQSLFGSRVAVGNVELRFPLIRNTLHGNVQLPPVELFGFADAGAAWGKLRDNNGDVTATHLQFTRGPGDTATDRGFLTSGGVGARINLFGYLIAEADFVKPFDRPEGWHWQFSFQPGF
jgi:outer membrane protein assembly factor BamA